MAAQGRGDHGVLFGRHDGVLVQISERELVAREPPEIDLMRLAGLSPALVPMLLADKVCGLVIAYAIIAAAVATPRDLVEQAKRYVVGP